MWHTRAVDVSHVKKDGSPVGKDKAREDWEISELDRFKCLVALTRVVLFSDSPRTHDPPTHPHQL